MVTAESQRPNIVAKTSNGFWIDISRWRSDDRPPPKPEKEGQLTLIFIISLLISFSHLKIT